MSPSQEKPRKTRKSTVVDDSQIDTTLTQSQSSDLTPASPPKLSSRKKRKSQAALEGSDVEPATPSSSSVVVADDAASASKPPKKKRKSQAASEVSVTPVKPAKKKKNGKGDAVGSGEDRLPAVTVTSSEPVVAQSSSFATVQSKINVHLAPCFIGKVMQGVNEVLDRFLMRHVAELDGVVLSYTSVKACARSARILYDSPYLHFHVSVLFTVFRPLVGSTIDGVVNKVSPDHIGLLVHGVFNASIPADRIRKAEFRYIEGEGDLNAAGWKCAGSAGLVLGVESVVRFTIAELMTANQMLTIVGSLTDHPTETGLITSADLPPAPLGSEMELGEEVAAGDDMEVDES
ncbi:hypothetical protein HKX48_003837 [Thoreauomyces humboldtii]|nr:hypothetical protein HKX48_003837 [Thoreauomyces humboldtii]